MPNRRAVQQEDPGARKTWPGDQGGNTQRRQAVNSFEQKVLEEIEGLE